MANHEYLFRCRSFDPTKITQILTELCKTEFKGLFKVKEDDEFWTIYCIYDETIYFSLWLDYLEYKGLKYKCIEARHRPGDFLWWIDIKTMIALYENLGGLLLDDGYGKPHEPNTEEFTELKDWLMRDWVRVYPDINESTVIEFDLGGPPTKKSLKEIILDQIPDKRLRVLLEG